MKNKKVKSLLNKGYENFGMLQEAKIKCLMLKNKIKEKNINKKEVVDIKMNILKIKEDINKYSKRVINISDKLKKYKEKNE